MEIVKIDLVPSGVMPSCHASQYDIGREIRFLLTDGGEEYTLAGTETISIELRKPDGTSETIAIPNTSSNYVDWETSDGELDLSGVYLAEISIKNGDDVLGSANFIVKTEVDAYDGADIRTITVGPADICTFETTLPEPLQSVLVNVLATGGNGTPDNPNPINGYSSANITRCGVNLWNEETESGSINSLGQDTPSGTQIRTVGYVSVKPSTTYYLKTPKNVGLFYYDASKTLISSALGTANTTFTTPSNCAFMRWYFIPDYGTTYNNDTSINYPSTDTTYHAYNGNTYTVAFGQTVYGGVLDVTRGKLTVTHLLNTYLGSADENWQKAGSVGNSQRFYIENQGEIKSINSAISNYLTPADTFDHAFGTFRFATNQTLIVHDNAGDFSDVASFKTYLSSNNLQICYELATPFDIDLTPEVISAIAGTNNVFADCGETTVKYLKAGA